MNIMDIKSFDMNNGEGVRVSLWVAGCPHHCEGCHNQEAWDKDAGIELTNGMMLAMAQECEGLKELSILGGEPLAPYNVDDVTGICKFFKEVYPDKSIWLWTGYTWEEIAEYEIMQYLDIVVDGKYDIKLHDDKLMWKGSSNQRVIDVKKSTKEGVVLYETD